MGADVVKKMEALGREVPRKTGRRASVPIPRRTLHRSAGKRQLALGGDLGGGGQNLDPW